MDQTNNNANKEEIIKTTAKIQDTDKPLIQTPLRTSQRGSNMDNQAILLNHTNDLSSQIENVNKKVLDNGKILLDNSQIVQDDIGVDNPFRPGSDICREAEPIVDYYKSGFNHSRGQSPVFPGLQNSDKNNDGKLLDDGKQNNNGAQCAKKRTCCKCSKCWPCCTIS